MTNHADDVWEIFPGELHGIGLPRSLCYLKKFIWRHANFNHAIYDPYRRRYGAVRSNYGFQRKSECYIVWVGKPVGVDG